MQVPSLSLCLNFAVRMNNFRFEKFVSWTDLNFAEPQESQPLCPPGIDPKAKLFGSDYADFVTWSELSLIEDLLSCPSNGRRLNFVSVPESQLNRGSTPLCNFYVWVALPENRLINFATTGTLKLQDFPFLGNADDGLKINLSLSARSAILFATFAQSKSRMDFPNDPEKFDSEGVIKLLSFKLSASKLLAGLGSQDFTLWNRKYLDYFISCTTLTLDMVELETLKVFEFGTLSTPLSTSSGTTFSRNFQGSVVETTLPASSSSNAR